MKIRLRHRQVIVSLVIIAATLPVFWQVTQHDFLNFDDNTYVTENPQVQAGLTKKGIIWAFTTTYANFWHPLTWLSYMVDCQLFGLKPGMHHLSNLLLHTANTVLLFLVLTKMTGALWRSAFVAALFGLHPLHVESVAWISQRKDTLSTLFWLLTMWGYFWYSKRPGVTRYLLVLFLFILGLMAKPMLVTLPFLLLLLDYWPLRRFQFAQWDAAGAGAPRSSSAMRLVLEKTPFLVVAAGSAVVAFLAQQAGGAIGSLDKYPVGLRIANALVSYASYVVKMFWPQNLALPYPHPGVIPIWKAVGAALLLVVASVWAIRGIKRYPYLAVGWLWYLGTLVPVSGLVQVGSHAMADRYTYVPLIGLFILVAWAVPDLLPRWRYRTMMFSVSTGVILIAFMVATRSQLSHWKNSTILFEHALHVTRDNVKAHNNLGTALLEQGKFDEAYTHFLEALRINPNNATLHYNLGLTLSRQGRLDQAITHYSLALQINPNLMQAHRDLGTALMGLGRVNKAAAHFSQALQIQPENVEVRNNLGNLLLSQGRIDAAIAHFAEALRIREDYIAYYNLGNALLEKGDLDEAIGHFAVSLHMKPDNAMTHNNMGNALARKGSLDEAVAHYSEALRIRPDDEKVHCNLGLALMRQQQFEKAASHFSEALRIRPDFKKARHNLEQALQLMKRSPGAPNAVSNP